MAAVAFASPPPVPLPQDEAAAPPQTATAIAEAASAKTPASPSPTVTTAVNPAQPSAGRFSFDALRRSISRQDHGGHQADEGPISHQARLLFACLTGYIPPPPEPTKRLSLAKLNPSRRNLPSPTRSVVSLATIAEPEVSDVKATKGGKATKTRLEVCRPVPNVKPRALRKLKADLVKADKARAIVADLKRMEVPPDDAANSTFPAATHPHARAYALQPFDDPSVPSTAQSEPTSPSPPPPPKPADLPFTAFELPSFAALPPTSAGGLGGLAGAKTGVFEILSDASGALVEKSGVHDGMTVGPPVDRVSIFIWWWGFEICLPPPAIKTLSSVASVQQSFFTFLQAFVAAGGAPELAPLVRYLSSYCDMEWQAIRAQNRGDGVVLAATWLLPVALVPRPWDFPLPSPSHNRPYPVPPPLPRA